MSLDDGDFILITSCASIQTTTILYFSWFHNWFHKPEIIWSDWDNSIDFLSSTYDVFFQEQSQVHFFHRSWHRNIFLFSSPKSRCWIIQILRFFRFTTSPSSMKSKSLWYQFVKVYNRTYLNRSLWWDLGMNQKKNKSKNTQI